jgi:hypothetical protein
MDTREGARMSIMEEAKRVTRRQYTPEYKAEAIRVVTGSGKTAPR